MTETTTPSPSTAGKRQWSSQFAFLMATIGASVGLGNLWRFPFQAGENGGSAFVFVYFACVIFLAVPVMMGELAVGRRGKRSAAGSTAKLATDQGKSPAWGGVGLIGVLATFMVLTIYGVIAGRIMAFSLMGFLGQLSDINANTTMPLYDGTVHALAWQALFMIITIAIVMRGLHAGIERFTTLLMPLFFVMLAGLCIFALSTGAGGKAVSYLFAPRFEDLNAQIILAAVGQAFFSIGVGAGLMMTYGAFLSGKENLAVNSVIIAGADTSVAIIAGLMIFPIVFAFNLDPAAGMGLIFSAMPNAFAGMPFGALIAGSFFFLAFIAALTSSISMLMLSSVIGEEQLKLKRAHATLIFGVIAWAIGAASIVAPDLSETIDFLAGQVAMPVGAILSAIFAGWVAPRLIMREELSSLSSSVFSIWRFIVRYLAPIGITIVLILGLDAHFGWGVNAFLSGGAGGAAH